MEAMSPDSLAKPKHSRFRHVYAKSVRRSEWYDTGAGHGLAVAVNPKMIALSVDVPAGGLVQIAKLCSMGKGHMELSKIKDHTGIVCDVKWNPFNDNVLATSSQDATVRIWHIDDMLRVRCLRISHTHSRRVHIVEWHPTVDNVLLSASMDGRIAMWDIEDDRIIYVIKECYATSLSLNYNATEFAVSTKSRQLIIYDARTAQVKRSSTLVHDGSMLPHVVHCGRKVENERLITTGNSRNTRRQIAVYHANSIDCPLITVDVDGASGRLIPIADNDLNLLYVAGKGDSNIRFYELYEESPHISYLNESAGTRALTAVGYLPKRGLDVAQCEIMRLFRVDAEQLVIEPMSFIVPRRADSFQVDLFPPTRSPTPALSFAEWFGGLDREPILLELRDCILNCTNKPVTFAKIGFAKKPKLLTSDVNNDRKFRFLAQVTKPDYRSVSDREDCKELLKLREVREKIAAESKANAVIAEDPGDDTVNNKANGNSAEDKKADVGENGISPEVAAMNHRNIFLIDSRSEASEIMDTESLPSENRTENRTGMCRHNRSSVSFDESHLLSTRKRNGVRDKPAYKVISPLVHPKPKVKSPDEDYVWPSEETKSNSQSESEEMLVNVISELEKELSKCRCRCQQLETFVRTQEKDIESLRFEIQWKDGRIEYLQSQLTELDNARSNSSHSS